MACQGVLSVAVLALVAMANGAPPAAPAVGRQLQQNQNGQYSYCQGITATNFEGSGFRYTNNLGTGRGLTYYNVMRLQDGTPINLKVTNSTPYYPPTNNQPATGIVGQNVGQIGLGLNPSRPDGECFRFEYVNANTGEPVQIGPTILTFLDADNVYDGCREAYRVCDSDAQILTSPNSGLTKTTVNDGCRDIFSSRTEVSNPTNTHSLTTDQTEAGFGVRFQHEFTMCMRLDGENCDRVDRQFNFGGLSNIDNCRQYGSTSGTTGGGTGGSTSGTSSSGSSYGGGALSGGGSTANGGGSGPGAASNGGVGAGSAPAACGSTCTYAGRTSTCQDLVRSVQRDGVGGSSDSMKAGPVACANAWAVVVDACNACRDCGRDDACYGMFEVGPEVWPQETPRSRAVTFTAAGLAACLAAAAAVLGLARGPRPLPAATAEGLEEAGPAQPLVDELSA